MLNKLKELKLSNLLLISLLFLLAPLFYYYLFYVPSHEMQLTQRYTRLLSITCDQFESRLKNLNLMFQKLINGEKNLNYQNNEIIDVNRYLGKIGKKIEAVIKHCKAKVDPNCTIEFCENLSISEVKQKCIYFEKRKNELIHRFEVDVSGEVNRPCELLVFRGGPFAKTLFLPKDRPNNQQKIPYTEEMKSNIAFKLSFNKIADELCVRAEFEDFLIFDKIGDVIYKREKCSKSGVSSGLRIIRLDDRFILNGALGTSKNGDGNATKQWAKPADSIDGKKLSALNIANTLVQDVEIAGVEYKLFLQPFILPISSGKNQNLSDCSSEWFLGGLVKSETFRLRSQQISTNWLLLLTLFLLLLLISYPVIKFWIMTPQDRFKIRDALFLWVFIVIIIPIGLYVLLTATHYFVKERAYSEDMKKIAKSIHDDFQCEIEKAYKTLESYKNNKANSISIKQIQGKRKFSEFLQVLHVDPDRHPLYDMFFLINEKGKQNYKTTIGDIPSFLVDVSDRRYFSAIKNKQCWDLGEGKLIALEPGYSYSTGNYEINLAIPVDSSEANDTKNEKFIAAAVSIKPLSIMKPILPYGYEFAIVEENGKALFHSDQYLSSLENYFMECNAPRVLSAAIRSRNKKVFSRIRYHGESWKVYVQPIKNLPWSLIIMRENDVHESFNFVVNAIAMFKYLLYLSTLGLFFALFILFLIGQKKISGHLQMRWIRLHQKFRWLWPDCRFSKQYYIFSIINMTLFIVLIGLSLSGILRGVVPIILPLIILLSHYVVVMKEILKVENGKIKGKPDRKFLPSKFFLKERLSFSFLLPVVSSIVFIGVIFVIFAIPQLDLLLLLVVFSILLHLLTLLLGRKMATAKKMCRFAYIAAFYSTILLLLVFPALHFWFDSYRDVSTLSIKHQQFHLARNYCERNTQYKQKFEIQPQIKNETNPGNQYVEFENRKNLQDLNQGGIYALDSYISCFNKKNTKFIGLPCQLKELLDKFASHKRPIFFDRERDFLNSSSSMYIKNKAVIEIPNLFSQYILCPNSYFRQIYFLDRPQNLDDSIIFSHSNNRNCKYHLLIYSESFDSKKDILVLTRSPKVMRWIGPRLYYWLLGIVLSLLFVFLFLPIISKFFCDLVLLVGIKSDDKNSKTYNGFKKSIFTFPGKYLLLGDSIDTKKLNREFGFFGYNYVDLREKSPGKVDYKKISRRKKPLFILNFDSQLHDAHLNYEKLGLMENLVMIPNISVVVVSQHDPVDYFNLIEANLEGDNQQNAALEKMEKRWGTCLAEFQRRYLFLLPETDSSLVSECDYFLNCDCTFLFPREKKDTEEESGDASLNSEVDERLTGVEDFRNHLTEFARPTYEKIWRTCTWEEKIALVHLAEDRLANSKNSDIIRKLMKRGLIKISPLRLRCNSFRRFILSVDKSEILSECKQKKVGQGIKKLSSPFMIFVIGALGFLAFTQPDILRYAMVLIPALASAIPSLLNVSGQAPKVGIDGD